MEVAEKLRPMLAATFEEGKLKLPCILQPKINGIRALAMDGVARSRTFKPLPNQYIQNWFARESGYLQGFDGELIVGEPKGENVFRPSTSGIMTGDGSPDFRFCVFDIWDQPGIQFEYRYRLLEARLNNLPAGVKSRIILVQNYQVAALADLLMYEDKLTNEGYEGIILRAPDSGYKYGRSTLNQFWLVKKKLWITITAKITGTYELMHNANEATTNDVGYTKRSSHKEGKVPSGMLGGYTVQEVSGRERVFNVGSFLGFGHDWRRARWQDNEAKGDIGKLAQIKVIAKSDYDTAQNPIFEGFRDEIDFDADDQGDS